jgi:rRNA maturation endonuclease Nob1
VTLAWKPPYWEDLRTGERCDECGAQLKDFSPTLPCPLCGSHLRRLPRMKGQAVADVIDVRERLA